MNQLKIQKFVSNVLMENGYVLYNDVHALVIDPGNVYNDIVSFLKQNKLKVLGVLLTHGHFDHCLSCKHFQDDGIAIYIHKYDSDKLYTDGNLSKMLNIDFPVFYADYLLEEGFFEIGEFKVEVIHTPGHSRGSVCYVIDDYFFSGDTFFKDGVGRIDFYDSSFIDLRNSLKKLTPYLKKPYIFCYGH